MPSKNSPVNLHYTLGESYRLTTAHAEHELQTPNPQKADAANTTHFECHGISFHSVLTIAP
jgi:hypothetical protein